MRRWKTKARGNRHTATQPQSFTRLTNRTDLSATQNHIFNLNFLVGQLKALSGVSSPAHQTRTDRLLIVPGPDPPRLGWRD
ncbi:hypothetical protein Pmani_025691 [Petrolisthes manimaculis]|uniref:Uncharacterized protein n=1 Tax=Petrolisthes manimaculis TaxID=1843537 RepID=A0AAE1U0X4_9EUCA|nr:hypothetical protein Pmani_025691 [Petrolisthes manimaculis]